MYEQGEVVLIPFPYSDLTGAKFRPALIISNKKINKTKDKICCLITSNSSTDAIFISKKDFSSSSLPFKSWVKPHRIFTINEDIIKKRLCKLNKSFNQIVLDNLDTYLEIE